MTVVEAIESVRQAGGEFVVPEPGKLQARVPASRPRELDTALATIRERRNEALALLGAPKPPPARIPPVVKGPHERPNSTAAATVNEGELRRCWATLWPGKPWGRLDEESGQWALKLLNRAGTRIVWVEGKRGLAVWPDQDGPEYRLALKLLKLDGHKLHSRDDPEIEKLIGEQYPRRRQGQGIQATPEGSSVDKSSAMNRR